MILLLLAAAAANGAETVSIPFRAVVGSEELACGRKYTGVGLSRSVITPRDFRLYIHNVRLLDEAGKEWPVDLAQDGKWVLDDVALLDFEDGSAGCRNGSPETNRVVTGTVPAGHVYRGLRFTLGVPFAKNHSDLMAMPSPHGDGLGVECGAAICPDRTGDRNPRIFHPSGQHGLHPGCAEQSAGKVRVAQPRGSGTEGLRAGPECGAGGSGCPPARFRCGAWRGL